MTMRNLNHIPALKGRIAEIENAIAEAIAGATPATLMTVQEAIKIIALPELDNAKRRLAQAIGNKRLEKFLKK